MTISAIGEAAAVVVVNDHTGPVVLPDVFRATICQKYCLLLDSAPGPWEAEAWPVDTCGGGLDVVLRDGHVVCQRLASRRHRRIHVEHGGEDLRRSDSERSEHEFNRTAARRLARYYRSIGITCRVLRHRAPSGESFFTVERS